MYRISYALGSTRERRVTRSVVVFDGATERRQWNGQVVMCLDFSRPHGRPLSILSAQLVDARPAVRNERGQVVLVDGPGPRRRRLSRRRMGRVA